MVLVTVRSARYVYYHPNDKDKKNKYGDCTIRALSKVLNCSWLEAFDKTIPICRENQVPNIFFAPATVRKKLLDQLGFDYCGYKAKRGEKRPTVNEFAKSHPTGTYILNVANHVVACVDGKYYDTWDSGRCCLSDFGRIPPLLSEVKVVDECQLFLLKLLTISKIYTIIDT